MATPNNQQDAFPEDNSSSSDSMRAHADDESESLGSATIQPSTAPPTNGVLSRFPPLTNGVLPRFPPLTDHDRPQQAAPPQTTAPSLEEDAMALLRSSSFLPTFNWRHLADRPAPPPRTPEEDESDSEVEYSESDVDDEQGSETQREEVNGCNGVDHDSSTESATESSVTEDHSGRESLLPWSRI